jgi:hypothetical protein
MGKAGAYPFEVLAGKFKIDGLKIPNKKTVIFYVCSETTQLCTFELSFILSLLSLRCFCEKLIKKEIFFVIDALRKQVMCSKI